MSQTTLLFDSLTGDPSFDNNPVSEGLSASFSTAAGTVSLTDVKIDLFAATPTDGGTMTVVLESDNNTSPGTPIATLGTIADSSLSSDQNNATTIDLPLGSGPLLPASTRYWIDLVPTSSSAEWMAGGIDNGPGVNSEFYDIANQAPVQSNNFSYVFEMQVSGDQACFRAGTPILTTDGMVAVEDLGVGTELRLASGGVGPVRWLGHRRVDCRHHPRPWDVWPVRVSANAFGPGAPRRDIFLSPDHAVFHDGVLIPIRYLLNGATIRQEETDDVTYWHVELAQHAVLLADGLACETYLDTGNRTSFEHPGAVMALHAEFAPCGPALEAWELKACAPLVWSGPALDAARQYLIARLPLLGHAVTADPDLRIIVDGAELEHQRDGRWIYVALPDGAAQMRLQSRTAAPAELDPASEDRRRLGLPIAALTLDGQTAPLTSARLGQGWHAPEPGLRWTDGLATIDVRGATVVELCLASSLPIYHAASPARVPRVA